MISDFINWLNETITIPNWLDISKTILLFYFAIKDLIYYIFRFIYLNLDIGDDDHAES